MALLLPSISPSPTQTFFISSYSSFNEALSVALRTLINSLSLSIGFSRKSNAPKRVALIAFSTLP